jgi:hypothetical protein
VGPHGESLFDADVLSGFSYRSEFLTASGEAALAGEIRKITFAAFSMRGVVARRRVAFFGESYDRSTAPPLPEFLRRLRAMVAEWVGVEPAAFAMALVNEYQPGAPIGWHRDAPQYGVVAGVSLLASCRMKFRPYVPPGIRDSTQPRRIATHEVTLASRSAYLMVGDARSAYEHHIPAVDRLRYSVTFRTLRSPAE